MGNGIDDECAPYIGQLKQLVYLNLKENIPIKVIEQISQLKKLRTLKIELGIPESLQYIGELVDLTHLEIYYCNIGDEHVKYLSNLKQLTFLDISENYIGNEGFEIICELTQLTNLNINNNNVGNEGIDYISQLVNLKYLDIGSNKKITDEHYFECFQPLKQLIEIEVYGSHIFGGVNLRDFVPDECSIIGLI